MRAARLFSIVVEAVRRPSANCVYFLVPALALLSGCGRQTENVDLDQARSGSFGSALVDVPASAVFIWEPDKHSDRLTRKCGMPMRSAGMRFVWPGMQPAGHPSLERLHRSRFGPNGDAQWIEVGMSQGTVNTDLSMSKLRDWMLYRSRRSQLPPGMTFEFGDDADVGLSVAYPSLESEAISGWNRRIYSDSFDPARNSGVLISCLTGPQYSSPVWTPLCKQELIVPDFERVHIGITYRKNLLPHWRQIESDVRQYLDRVSSRCSINSGVKDDENG